MIELPAPPDTKCSSITKILLKFLKAFLSTFSSNGFTYLRSITELFILFFLTFC